MKRMIVKAPYSKCQIVLTLLLIGLLTSCGTTKKTLAFNTTFQGYSVKGRHARALAVVDRLAIVAGAEGYASLNFLDQVSAGANNSLKMEGVEDFRDIYYTNEGACYFMNSGKNGIIWKITMQGQEEKVLDTAGVFLDGLDFWSEQGVGIVYGDPIGGKFFLAKTLDNGNTWNTFKPATFPPALENEGGFAASGSGIQTIGDSTVYFATGLGETARLFCSYDQGENWEVKDTPMRSGDESYGIYSMYFWAENEGMIIGGSYKDSTYNTGICQYTIDGGDTWKNRSAGLPGYCSCIHGTEDGELLVATGRSGTFYSLDKGKSWQELTIRPYYTCYVSEREIILSGKNGTLEFINYIIVDEEARSLKETE